MVKAVAMLMPVLVVVTALIGGAAAGDWLRTSRAGADPATGAAAEAGDFSAPGTAAEVASTTQANKGANSAEAPLAEVGQSGNADRSKGDLAYLKFPQQFFVPLVRDGTLRSVMILDISLELPEEVAEPAYRQESRLRDALLRALLIHANSGGFDGNFTADAHVELLRETLLQTAHSTSGLPISGVMIGDIARQEQ